MSNYHQSDTLFTDTNLPMSGTGSSIPESAVRNADYTAWPWEVMLATVLDIAAPDRGEVTGQPWLTVLRDGQNPGGAHLIWTASWDTSPQSGATSVQVYLNPALYTLGGAWDRFLNAPPQGLASVTTGSYAGLPLKPPDFQEVSLAAATVRDWMAAAADHLAVLHQDAFSGPVAKLQGNLAEVVAELLGDLRRFLASLHEQMSHPIAYDASIAAAGEAASRFLADLMSAYSDWTRLPEHSPLGAVVQVLEDIATPDSSGGYVIPDPQNSPYGDLTVSGSWTAVERQAKTAWTSTLTGGAPDFAGLDPLGRVALRRLVEQFAATTGDVVPVLGPATPPPSQHLVHPGGHGGHGGNGDPGRGNSEAHVVGGPGPSPHGNDLMVQPGGGGRPVGPVPAGGVPSTEVLAGGAPGGGAPGRGLPSGGAPGGGAPGGGVPGGGVPGGGALASELPGGHGPGHAGGPVFAVGLVGLGGTQPGTNGLGGPQPGTNEHPADPAPNGDPSPAAGEGGFSGSIGRPEKAISGAESERRRGLRGKRDRKGVPLGGPQAPAAGFSLGRDPGGPVFKRLAVPAIVARPPAITSSPVNSQPAPASGGATGPASLPVSSASGSLTTGGPAIGAGEPMTPQFGGMGMPVGMGDMPVGMGAPGSMGTPGGQAGGERQRIAYLPEEPDFWDTAPAIGGTCMGAGDPADFDDTAEPEFVPVITPALGSAARTAHESAEESTPDKRRP